MALLVMGVILWSAVHLLPTAGSSLRSRLVDKLGESAYKGLFALLILSALGLMILGWRSAETTLVYLPPAPLRPLVLALMVLSFLLFGASGRPTRIGRIVRHPQLTGLLTWAVAHLLANGDSRSLVLFGGLGLWSLAAIVTINRRDGAWVRPEPPPLLKDAVGVLVSLALLALVIYLHPWIAGVPALPV
jgi:uncharacterized membrane protein